MNKEQLQRTMEVVKEAADLFGGIYSLIWEGVSKEPGSVSNTAFLSVYKDCKDAMDFALAYELPETSIFTSYRIPNNARFR